MTESNLNPTVTFLIKLKEELGYIPSYNQAQFAWMEHLSKQETIYGNPCPPFHNIYN
jgi:hypothetical protein